MFCLAYLVFCLAYLVFCLAYLVFYLAYLVFGGLFGVHYIFFGVIGICGIGILYLLHLEFGMVHLIFSSQKNAQILRSLWKKVRRFEKGTPPPVVAVVTIIRCGHMGGNHIAGCHNLQRVHGARIPDICHKYHK